MRGNARDRHTLRRRHGAGRSRPHHGEGSQNLGRVRIIAHFRKRGSPGHAWTIARPHIKPGVQELALEYPVTTEIAFTETGYIDAISRFYSTASESIRHLLEEGQDVALLSEGDPFFYGSFLHMYERLRGAVPIVVVPGVTGMSGCWTAAAAPIALGDDVLTVLPGTLGQEALIEKLRSTDAAAIMKVGYNLPKIREALVRRRPAGRGDLCGTRNHGGRADRAAHGNRRSGAVFLHRAGAGLQGAAHPMSGRLTVIGLGPGPARWMTPAAGEALAAATDIFGYKSYVERMPARPGQRVHESDNRVELQRAEAALAAAQAGRRAVLVSGGDPGVFAMAAAVFEAIERGPKEWRSLEVIVEPGVTAMLAAAARIGAPLGHDFCAISLSDNLKPWSAIEKRLRLACEADFAMALYNPASLARPEGIHRAFEVLRQVEAAQHRDRVRPRHRPRG